MRKTLLLCCVTFLWSCNTPGDYGQESPYYRYPENGRFVLNQALEIPANWATARLQSGKVVPFGHVQEQEPHCIVELDKVLTETQRIEPDVFTIIRVQRSISELAAASGFFIRAAFTDGNRPTQMFYKTIFTLKSDKQPDVLRMICQSDQYAAGMGIPRHLSVLEIRRALGKIFTLELP